MIHINIKGIREVQTQGNSHFSVTIKSKKLDSLSRIQGQRAIHKVLEKGSEMQNQIHAISIKIL